jgi:kynureninase
MKFKNAWAFAKEADQKDSLAAFRKKFIFPKHQGKTVAYFCGNSLGLQPKSAAKAVNQELKDWGKYGVEGHFEAKHPWFSYHHFLTDMTANLVGAKKEEVVVMNNLTTNLHLMMVSFYRPDKKRYKIIMEGGAFPSDYYALGSQAKFHGRKPEDVLIELKPRAGEHTLRTEDIIEVINTHKDSLALVMMGGVNYYTGQAFEMDKIAEAAHQVGAYAGFDLAHAAGNLLLKLHDWNIDFAVWCGYKYLNSGPGGTSGVFIHEKHIANADIPRFAGWWGHNEGERFKMSKTFDPIPTAEGWQLSNAQILPMALHMASLKIFEEAGIKKLRAKSEKLTGYLEFLLKETGLLGEYITCITPADVAHRGCQLSLVAKKDGKKLHQYLTKQGIVTDWREPDVIRAAPVPLYNSFQDVYRFVDAMRKFYKK